MSFLFLIAGLVLIPAPQPDTLVICPPDYQVALQPWVNYRQQQGHNVLVLPPANSSYGIKQTVQRVAASGKLKFVVLIGDAGDRNGMAHHLVPTDYVKAEVNVKFGSEPEIATDNTYADPDGDGIPDLAIGRLPVDSPQELTRIVNRIIEYESSESNGPWQRKINFVAGVGGFGELIDKLIEQTTKKIVTDLIPASYETTMTYGSWTSPYCPDPRRFSETSIQRFNEGCLFWVYIGHGARHRLDKIYLPDQSHQILDCQTASQLNCPNGSPIAVCLACYTGATDDEHDCLAETMLSQPRGPIAVMCGTRVTMPYAMSVLSLEILKEYFDGETPTLGQLILLGKQRMMGPIDQADPYRNMIEGMGKAFSPRADLLDKERREHVDLIHLIGDPLLRLKRPEPLEVAAQPKANAGDSIAVSGTSPAAGEMVMEVSFARDRFRHRPPRRKEYDSSDSSFQDYQTVYEQSQDLVCQREVIRVSKGAFSTEVKVPENANGECVLRVMLHSTDGFALGSAPVEVASKPKHRQTRKPVLVPKKSP